MTSFFVSNELNEGLYKLLAFRIYYESIYNSNDNEM